MTKAELIIRFSNTAGIPDADAKIFFELLLKRISALLKSSQSIFIPEYGYFHLIKGKIKKPSSEFIREESAEELLDIILYSQDDKLSQSETKGFVFNIPFFDEEDYYPVDSYFSLSIGKPLIPLRGVLTDNSFTPTAGYEYRRLLESKVDDIIAKSKIITPEEQYPILIIDASSYNTNQVQLEKAEDNLDSMLSDIQSDIEKNEDATKQNVVKNIAWDFGEDLSRKISADSILDLTDERLNNYYTETNDIVESEKELIIPTTEENILDELLKVENEKDVITPQFNKDEFVENKKPEITSPEAERLLDDLDDFEEVKSNLSDDKNIDDEISDEEFWKSTSKLFETYNPREIRSEQDNEFTEVKSPVSNLGDFSATVGKIKLAPEKVEDEQVNEEVVDSSEAKVEIVKDENQPEHKRKRWTFVILPILLILIAAGFYYYNQVYKKNTVSIKPDELSLKSNNTNIIERDFQIPITYPYPPEKNIVDNTKSVNESNVKTEQPEKNIQKPEIKNLDTQKPKREINKVVKNAVPAGNPVSIGNNIYRYGDIYVVQVASFRSNSIAENEAGKYRNKGYNSFVEAVEIPEKGLWYRIKVGNFSSVDEAKNFISKNIR